MYVPKDLMSRLWLNIFFDKARLLVSMVIFTAHNRRLRIPFRRKWTLDQLVCRFCLTNVVCLVILSWKSKHDGGVHVFIRTCIR